MISRPDAKARYRQLYDISLWLPCDFRFVFKTEGITGVEMLVGSSVSLLRQLQDRNARRWLSAPEALH
jgi:hypothetical protein